MSRYLLDVDTWLALAISGHSRHRRSAAWFSTRPGGDQLAFCRSTQHGFFRLLTNAAVMAPYGDPPLTNEAAWSAFDALCADDRVAVLSREPAGIDARWRSFATRRTASTRLWTDAYLAAFAVTAGMRLVTSDAAFGQFHGLDLELV